MKRALSIGLMALALGVLARAAGAVTVTVGTGAGCNHATLQAAFTALASQTGTHTIRLRKETFAIPDGVTYQPTVNQVALYLEGGFNECADTTPASGQTSTLDATGGLLTPAVRLWVSGRVNTIQIRRVIVRGGDALDPANAYNGVGGGLQIHGPASVLLGASTQVRDNQARYGGGIALVGGLLTSTTPAKVDLYIDEGAAIYTNTATVAGGGIYCGGATVVGAATPELRHGSIIGINGTIGFNNSGAPPGGGDEFGGGAFYCHGTVEGGGGFQPRPGEGARLVIVGNNAGTSNSQCASGSGTLDTSIGFSVGGYRSLGAADGSNGLLVISSNQGKIPALCLYASRQLGTTGTYPPVQSTFKLQNLYVGGQWGTRTLGIDILSTQLRLRIQPSGRNVVCTTTAGGSPVPCVTFTNNHTTDDSGTGYPASLVASDGTLEIAGASIRGNTASSSLILIYQGSGHIESSLIEGNTVRLPSPDFGSFSRSAFDVNRPFGVVAGGSLTILHTTVLFATPLDRFISLNKADSSANARAVLFSATSLPAPANAGGVAPLSRFHREWCGYYQTSEGFASHTVTPDPTSGVFTMLVGGAVPVASSTFAPTSSIMDRCTRSTVTDFYGKPFGSVHLYPPDPPADIGAIENRNEVIFADGLDVI